MIEPLTEAQVDAYINIGADDETVGQSRVDTVRLERKHLAALALTAKMYFMSQRDDDD